MVDVLAVEGHHGSGDGLEGTLERPQNEDSPEIGVFRQKMCIRDRPMFFEMLPLTLEEIFISETEVVGYDVKSLLL